MNQIQLIGRLTRNPELRYTNSNKPVANFTIAVNRIGQDNVDFINCVVWNNQAEKLCKYQEKGSLIGIVGSLRVEQYQDSNGNNKSKTYVFSNNIEYLESKKRKEESNSVTTKEKEKNIVEEKQDAFQNFADEVELSDEDLPF